jgi:hypothetical protein
VSLGGLSLPDAGTTCTHQRLLPLQASVRLQLLSSRPCGVAVPVKSCCQRALHSKPHVLLLLLLLLCSTHAVLPATCHLLQASLLPACPACCRAC